MPTSSQPFSSLVDPLPGFPLAFNVRLAFKEKAHDKAGNDGDNHRQNTIEAPCSYAKVDSRAGKPTIFTCSSAHFWAATRPSWSDRQADLIGSPG